MPLRKSKAEIEDIASRLNFEQRKLVNETIRKCGCPCHQPLENGNGLLSEFFPCCEFSFMPLLDIEGTV